MFQRPQDPHLIVRMDGGGGFRVGSLQLFVHGLRTFFSQLSGQLFPQAVRRLLGGEADTVQKALDIEALLRRLGVTRKLTGFQYVCYMVNQVVEDPSRLSLITKRLYPETARHFHTTRDSIELATRNVIRAVWGQADHRLLDHIAGIHLEKRPSNCEFIDILSSFLSRPQEDKEISSADK